jgi:hypothetical protein
LAFMTCLAVEPPVILIVEDELLVRTSTAEIIRDAGFEVLEAANADETIVILETRRDIRVVFYGYSHTELDEWSEVGPRHPGSLAASPYYRNLRTQCTAIEQTATMRSGSGRSLKEARAAIGMKQIRTPNGTKTEFSLLCAMAIGLFGVC